MLDGCVLLCFALQVSHAGTTLFFMPFAPYDLTDAVIRANWPNLSRVAIIGNNLDFVTGACFEAGSPSQHLRGRAKATEAARRHAVETSLLQSDLVTWIQEAKGESSEEKLEEKGEPRKNPIASCLNATLVTFQTGQCGKPWQEMPPPQPTQLPKETTRSATRSRL